MMALISRATKQYFNTQEDWLYWVRRLPFTLRTDGFSGERLLIDLQLRAV